jgi:flagellar hook-associated protein 2
LGDSPVQLLDGEVELQDAKTVGRLAMYEVYGSGVHTQSDTRTVTVASGLSVTMLSESATPANITISRSTSALTDAIQNFATAYNAAADELDKHRGIGGGDLQGEALIGDLANVLSTIATYSGGEGAPLSGLGELGLELGDSGRFTFASFTLLASDLLNSNGVTSFLGSATTGGFLKAATDAMNLVHDAESGLIPLAVSNFDTRIAEVESDIAAKQAQVDQFEERLITQIAAADALIASMQQQYSYLASMFDAMQASSESYG